MAYAYQSRASPPRYTAALHGRVIRPHWQTVPLLGTVRLNR